MGHPEEWKPIPGYDGYEVSSLGRVRCWRKWGFRAATDVPRVLKPKGGPSRYLSVILGYRGPSREIHRLVAEQFVPGRGLGLEVAHENGNKHDNRASNLRWKTRKENQKDKLRHGTHGKTLTPNVVVSIREEYSSGVVTQKELAMKYGTTQSTVSKIINKQRWEFV